MVHLDSASIPLRLKCLDSTLQYISCNNDQNLGKMIGEAYEQVGKDGVVLMEESDTNETIR